MPVKVLGRHIGAPSQIRAMDVTDSVGPGQREDFGAAILARATVMTASRPRFWIMVPIAPSKTITRCRTASDTDSPGHSTSSSAKSAMHRPSAAQPSASVSRIYRYATTAERNARLQVSPKYITDVLVALSEKSHITAGHALHVRELSAPIIRPAIVASPRS